MTVPTRLVADGGYSTENITAATNLCTGPGTVYRIIVNATAATISYIIDSTGTTQSAANTVLTIPASTTVGTILTIIWPFSAGISVVPGAGNTLAVSWSQ